ncbi:NAD(P)-binding protein [Chloropicon primus]|uniref:NAD(P)-binding protein n=1 Tax=Chloropicon primus TaxID=1764295 RepID=A0A5B8MUN8_9CHLO|nr:NAD(P)-binding protein [Chloropicon primus]UPR02334.1 NAD(P)-binding protein [Chloropicon primus]|eukprot:QDZ23120.1 NAD(P)-binding protein [Chloropicon primus]
MSASYRGNLLSERQALEVARAAKRVAVLGIKTADKSSQASYYVPEYLQSQGVEVVPVPVYYPEVKEILGERVYRTVSEVPSSSSLCIVDVFRRPKDLHQHLEDLLQAKPKCVWLQSGISDRDFEEELAKNGIKVVSSRCLLMDHQRAVRQSSL